MSVSSDKLQADSASTGSVSATRAAEDNGRYVPEHLRAAGELQAVLAISRALAGKLDLDCVLGVTVSLVADIIGAEGSSILLIDPDTGGMSFHVAAGPGAEAARSVPLPPGAGICGYVAKSGEPLIINNAQNDPRLYKSVDHTTGITTNSILCVPLESSERLWGVLELINKRHGADFDEQDLSLAGAVGAQIALALANAHLHGQIVRKERMAAIGQTVSGLAHCIKNILNGIRSGSVVVDRAMRADDFGKVAEGWQVVRRNNDMLGNLVLDMLSLAKEAKFSPFPTDVNDLAEQICALMADRAGERGIKIICTPGPGLPEVTTDPTQLYRCLLNLITNAVDACDDKGHVLVRVRRGKDRDRFTISVADDGRGIAPEHRGKLFGEFFTTKGSKGTGLGLPVTKKLINAMGGTVTFHTTLGKGTRFVIALPMEYPRDK